MKKTLKLALILGMATAAESALASSEGWYAGIGTGQSKMSDWASKSDALDLLDLAYGTSQCADCSFSTKVEDTDTGWKVFGGYQFNQSFALEASYIDLGEATAKASASASGDHASISAKAEAKAITIDGLVKLPAAQWLDIFAKVGVYSADLKVKIALDDNFYSGIAGSDSETENTTGLHFSLGADFNVIENVAIRAEWERLNKVEFKDGESDIDLLSISAIYKF